jgi:predicted RNA-binding protein associated with RNAse of E/G family
MEDKEECTPCDVLEELDKAYEAGEITKEEYLKALSKLATLA